MNTSSTIYLFIDGEYLRRRYSESTSKWFNNEGEIDFSILTKAFQARKSFYYDCIDDLKRQNESESEFNLRVDEQQAYFNKIREVDGCHIRLGHLAGTTEKKRHQKEVDVLLAVDMMYHAFRQNMTKAVLIAGDRDFKPVVERLVDSGIDVEVVFDSKSIAKELSRAADSHRRIMFQDYYDWSTEELKAKYQLPSTWTRQMLLGGETLIRRGRAGEFSIGLYEGSNTFRVYAAHRDPSRSRCYSDNDMERLKLYVEIIHGVTEWE